MRKRDDQLTVIFLVNRLQCVSFPYIFPTYMEIYCWILIFCFNIMRQYTMFMCTNMFRVRVRVQAKVEGELWYFLIVPELQNFPVKIDARKALGEHEGVAKFIVNYAIRFHLSHCNVPENLYCFCCSFVVINRTRK